MINSNMKSSWQNYFLCLPQTRYGNVDLEAHRDRLIADGPQIFSGQGEIEVWQRGESKLGKDNDSKLLSLRVGANDARYTDTADFECGMLSHRILRQ